MKHKLPSLVLLLTLLAGVTLFTSSIPSAASYQTIKRLTLDERRGQTIYRRGESPNGKTIVARVGELEVPASSLPCANCHGFHGEGLTEGGISAGGLKWSELTQPNGHAHETGRKHKPFDDRSVARATSDCIDPSGNKLLSAMPCYQLAPQDMTDLIAYLKRLETETEPGITAKEITIATMIPTEGALAPSGSAMRSALNAYFQELNSSGGIHQRTVALRFIEMVSNREVTISNLQGAMETDEVFAIIGGVMAGVDKEAFGLAQSWKVPIIGLITLLPEEGDNRYVFYFSPGMKDQARALVNFAAAKPDAKKSKLLVVYPEGILAKESADAIETQAQKLNWNVERKSYAGAVAAKLVEQLKGEPANAVFFLGSADETAAFLKEAALVNWTPKVLLLSTSIRNAASVPKEFKDRVFIAFPTIPADVSASAAGEYRSLREKYKLPEERLASQLVALAAAKVFVAAANKVGPELNREKFVNTLETLNNFETGLTHEITFGPRRRIGARGAYVVTVDVEKGSLSTVTGWVEAN